MVYGISMRKKKNKNKKIAKVPLNELLGIKRSRAIYKQILAKNVLVYYLTLFYFFKLGQITLRALLIYIFI